MRLPSRITSAWLRKHDACEGEVALFEETFPRGAAITAANYRKAREATLDVWWFTKLALTCREFDAALAEADWNEAFNRALVRKARRQRKAVKR